MTTNKCRRTDGCLQFCKHMGNEIMKSTNEWDSSSIFTHIIIPKYGEAVLCTPINGVINFCPFCGEKLRERAEESK